MFDEPIPALIFIFELVMIFVSIFYLFYRWRTKRLIKIYNIYLIFIQILLLFPLTFFFSIFIEKATSECPYCREEAYHGFLLPILILNFLIILTAFLVFIYSRTLKDKELYRPRLEQSYYAKFIQYWFNIGIVFFIMVYLLYLWDQLFEVRYLYWYIIDEWRITIFLGIFWLIIFIVMYSISTNRSLNELKEQGKKFEFTPRKIIMNKGIIISVLIFIFCIIGLTALGDYVSKTYRPIYSKEIIRNTENVAEENCLKTAESLNYTEIFQMSRYSGWQDSNNNPSFGGYVWTNVIDTQVIEFYDNKIDYLKKNDIKTHARFTYLADVESRSLIHVNVDDRKFSITDNNGNEIFSDTYYGMGRIAIFHGENYTVYNGVDFDENSLFRNESFRLLLNFTNCCVVKMSLSYSEYYAPLAAFWTGIDQYVILDENLTPQVIFIHDHGKIIS